MKKKVIESVVHDWIALLPFQMQALLMTGIRGADGIQKHDTSKCIVRYLRGIVLKAAADWNGTNNNDFMWGDYGKWNQSPKNRFLDYIQMFWGDHDHLPHHFIMHLFHCAEVVAYYHPEEDIREHWFAFYKMGCDSFHLNPETKEQMDERLNDKL